MRIIYYANDIVYNICHTFLIDTLEEYADQFMILSRGRWNSGRSINHFIILKIKEQKMFGMSEEEEFELKQPYPQENLLSTDHPLFIQDEWDVLKSPFEVEE